MRSGRVRPSVPVALAVCLSAAAVSNAYEVKLKVIEPAGIARQFEVVTVGVPLPPGKIADVKVLRLLNAEGREIYATFRPLAFYTWRPEKSVRWVEVTFPVDLAANGEMEVRLRDDGPPESAAPRRPRWRIMKSGTGVLVVSGGARFEISRQFCLFTRAWVDLNGNGRADKEERIIEKSLNHGGVARDATGRRYTSAFGDQNIEILHRDRLRCIVRVSGTHMSAEAGGFKRGLDGLYDYEATFTFRRGRPWVWVDYVLKNSPAAPRGSPVMKDYSLVTRLRLGGGVVGKVLADRVHPVGLAQGRCAVLYQDSDGTKQWQQKPAEPVVTDRQEQFQGFRLLTGPVQQPGALQAAGLQARGFVELGDARWGMMAGLLDFWQTYPKAVEIDGSGRVVFHLFPARAKKAHWIEDQGHVGHRLVYGLFDRGRERKRPTLDEFARMVSQPVYVRVPVTHMAACGALHDLGPYRMDKVPIPSADEALGKRAVERTRDREYGWQVYGSSWSKRTDRPPGTYDPIRDTDTLFRYAAGGARGWFALGLARARHLRDIRAYHVDGVEVFTDYTDLKAARAALPVGAATRPMQIGADLRAFMAGQRPRSRWALPEERSLSLDEVYNLYLLTGDPMSLTAAREIAAAARAYLAAVPATALRPGREVAMCLRALTKYHELVGHEDPRALADIKTLARRLKGVLAPARAAARADAPKQVTPPADSGLFLRALAMAYRVTGDDDVLDLAIGTGDWLVEYAVTPTGFGAEHAPGNELKPREKRVNVGEKPEVRGRHTVACLEPLAWAYAQTGQKRYLDAATAVEPFIGPAARAASVSLLPYYYHVAGGLDRIDTVPPAAVTDLKARIEGQDVVLTWTAPGDNGREGTATRYQVKYASRPIVDIPKLPDQEGTHASWWSAVNAEGEPQPAAAQTKQSMRLRGLKAGTHHIAIKTWDEAPNVSPISNVVTVEVE